MGDLMSPGAFFTPKECELRVEKGGLLNLSPSVCKEFGSLSTSDLKRRKWTTWTST